MDKEETRNTFNLVTFQHLVPVGSNFDPKYLYTIQLSERNTLLVEINLLFQTLLLVK